MQIPSHKAFKKLFTWLTVEGLNICCAETNNKYNGCYSLGTYPITEINGDLKTFWQVERINDV